MQITLVTGNPGKLAEWRRLCPTDVQLEAADIDLDEIQSLDSRTITEDKARRAFSQVGKPLLVEDVTAGLDKLNGLPGPFIKFFEKKLGEDALFKLAGDEAVAVVTCTIAYFDGEKLIFGEGQVKGTVVAPRGEGGFGFDKVFVPASQAKTFAEMSRAEKDTLSHRKLAIDDLFAQLV